MDKIEFDVNISRGDLYRFTMRHTYFSFSGIVGIIISLGSVGIAIARWKEYNSTTLIALFIIGALFTIIQPIMLYGKVCAQIKKNTDIKDTLHYVISEDGILVSQGEQEAFVKWYEVRKKVLAAKGIYLYMSPVRAFIFPASQIGISLEKLNSTISELLEKYGDEPEQDEIQDRVAESDSKTESETVGEESENE